MRRIQSGDVSVEVVIMRSMLPSSFWSVMAAGDQVEVESCPFSNVHAAFPGM